MREVMRAHTRELLEYPKILDQLAAWCAFSGGADMARTLRPSPQRITVETWLALTQEAYAYLAHQPDPSFGGVTDVTHLLDRAHRSAILLPTELREVQLLLERTGDLQRAFTRHAETYPGLADLASLLHPCPSLVAEIGRCIDERGEVASSASPALSRIRNRLRTEQGRLTRTLERLTSSSHLAPYLQDAIVTQRQGRYVVPVRVEHKNRVPGIVHDQSASGATLFLEPLEVVSHNNALRLLVLEEEKEIRRILTELTAGVAAESEAIRLNVSILSELDFTLAKARYGYAIKGNVPEILELPVPELKQDAAPPHHPGSLIWLRQARHPLIPEEEAVPLDFELGPQPGPAGHPASHMVVITGPNTGGKTVALKTVGLMVLMAQSGLMIPAGSGCRLSVFGDVHADIGDEQSIEQSLSTFSSHLTQIVSILSEASAGSLVILDEVGAGTDPEEGSALAIALLDHLRRHGITTLASTHYSDIKLYAHGTPGVCNAAMEFDVASLRPTFRLSMGLPGRSNALTIARRLGLNQDIVEQAKSHVQEDVASANSMLEDIRVAKQRIRTREDEIRQELELTRLARSELLYRLEQVETDRQAVLAEARLESERMTQETRQALERLRSQVTADIWNRGRGEKLETLAAAREQVTELADQLPPAMPEPAAPAPPAAPEVPDGPIEVGDKVWVSRLQTTAQVLSLDPAGKRAEVQAGAMRFKARLKDLALRQKAAREVESQVKFTATRAPKPKVGMELDIRGSRVDPGVAQVDQYLHDAYESRMPWVRVIHGKGTGQLRTAVRSLMRRHPHVVQSRPGGLHEGGEGVTVALFEHD